MSSAGQIVGGVVGTVVGTFLGYPMLGAQMGMMLGGALDPPKGPTINGPRLEDLTIQTSTYGATVPRAYGTITVSGNVFWLENNKLKETVSKKKSGGKGGRSQTTTKTYLYSATFAVGLVDTRALGEPITGVKRIWIGPDLWYDAGSTDPGTIAASNAAAVGFELYRGSDTQLVDPRISANLGVNASAYRGLAYIVFYDLPLAKYGNSLAAAQVKVEIVAAGSEHVYEATQQTIGNRQWKGVTYNSRVYCTLANNTNICATSPDGVTWTEYTMPKSAHWQCIVSNPNIILAFSYGSVCISEDDGVTWVEVSMPENYWCTAACYNGSYFLVATDSGPFFKSPDGFAWTRERAPEEAMGLGNTVYYGLAWNGSVFVTIAQGGRFLTSKTGTTGTWTRYVPGYGTSWTAIGVHNGRFCIASSNAAGNPGTYTSDDGYAWTLNIANFPGAASQITSDGSLFCATSYGDYCLSPDGVTWEIKQFPGGPVNAWNSLVWGGDVFVGVRGSNGIAATIQPYKIAATPVSLSHIVSVECRNSSILADTDIDVTALTQQVRGYRVGSIGAIRSALEPLQSVWPFDIVQHGYKVQFKPRNSGSVVDIPMGDLDARNASSERGVSLTTSRESDAQLPNNVTLKYLDFNREYDVGEQYAERNDGNSVNLRVLDIPVVLTGGEAANLAELLLYLYWLERYDVSFSLPPSYNQLEPADVVTLQSLEGNTQLRLTAVDNTTDGIVMCKAKYNSAAVYSPNAVGSDPVVSGPTIIQYALEPGYVLMDVPYMDRQMDRPSFLWTMYAPSDTFGGGEIYRTDDDGVSWDLVQGFSPPGGVVATATNAITAVDTGVWDKASVLNVRMVGGSSLTSVTDLAVLNGANHFAYGADGRWEIIAIQLCTLTGPGRYTCTDMIRGKFGTEWAMGEHSIGDYLILLDENHISLVGISDQLIGLPRTYRSGDDINSLDVYKDYDFTYQAVNLECLSPVYVKTFRDLSTNNWYFYWIRRSRTDWAWRDNVDADLGEYEESYDVEIYSDASFTTVHRTIRVPSAECTYTSGDQIIDQGTVKTAVFFKVYQVSSVVGRGAPAIYPGSSFNGANLADPNFNEVVFLTSNTGAEGNKRFRDVRGALMSSSGEVKTTTTTGPFSLGSSAQFDGVNDYIMTPGKDRYRLGAGDFCVEIIFKTSQKHGVLLDFYTGGHAGWQILLDSSGFLWFYTGGSVKTGSKNLCTGEWTYAAVTRELGNVHFYSARLGQPLLEDGIGTPYAANLNYTTLTFAIGAQVASRDPSWDFKGNIGPIRVTVGTARSPLVTPTADFPHG